MTVQKTVSRSAKNLIFFIPHFGRQANGVGATLLAKEQRSRRLTFNILKNYNGTILFLLHYLELTES